MTQPDAPSDDSALDAGISGQPPACFASSGGGRAILQPGLSASGRREVRLMLNLGDWLALISGAATVWLILGLWPAVHVAIVTIVILAITDQRRWRFNLSVLDDLPRLAAAVSGATMIVAAGFAVFDTTWDTTERVIGTVLAGVAIFASAVAGRAATFALARSFRRRGVGIARAVIVGAGQTGKTLGRAVEERQHHGVRLVGYVDDVLVPEAGVRLLGDLHCLPAVVRQHNIDLVLIAFSAGGSKAVIDPIRRVGVTQCEIFVVPRLYELYDGAAVTDLLDGIPVVRLRRLAFRSISWRVKRALDVAAAVVGLILTTPVLALVALAVRVETGPGVIYRQQRLGMEGRPFVLYKFRSMKPAVGEDEVRWSIDGDSRIGPVGQFIRATSLDELPQLVNVLRGDMSLVGPRPERPHFVDQFSASIPGYQHRHRMPAGLTGFAAVHGLRGDTGIRERAHFDNLYAESWSLWLDIKIILRTARQVLRRPAAPLKNAAPPMPAAGPDADPPQTGQS